MYTRRDLGKLALATLPATQALARVVTNVHGIQLGVAGYSYNTLPREGILDAIVTHMAGTGIGDCLLYGLHTEPLDLASKARPARGGFARGASGALGASGTQGRAPGAGRGPNPEQVAAMESLRQWHLTTPFDYYTAIRKKFAAAGLAIHSYDATLGNWTSDEDLTRACQVTKTLGAQYLHCVLPKSAAKRLAPIAEKFNIKVAFQGRPNMNSTDPEAMAKPADFEEAISYSKNFGTSIDVGDATGAGWDAFQFVENAGHRIWGLNLKDRTKSNVSMPWGQGDSRIKDILRLVRDRKYSARCYIDCDYATVPGTTRLADIKRCLDFAKDTLA